MNRTGPTVAVVATVLALVIVSVVAAESPLSALSRGQIDTVERQYSELQRAFEHAQATEYDLLNAYKAFYQDQDIYGDELKAWSAKYPKSASAQVATGVYYRKLGEFRRGTGYYQGVPADARQYLRTMYSIAKPHLEEALRLEPKSYIAVLHLLNIAQFEGNDAAARRYLERANSILPTNFLARARYMVHLAPKWGGSFNAMEKFLRECESAKVEPKALRWLKAIVAEERGLVAEPEKNWVAAETNYVAALENATDAGNRFHNNYLGFAVRLCSVPEHAAAPYCKWSARVVR